MDKFDLKILDALQDNGRLSNHELADLVGLSSSQCSRRRNALEQAGVIEHYPALLSLEAVGISIVAFVAVSLSTHSKENSDRFGELLAQQEAVQEAYALTGDADYLVKIVVPDLKALAFILNDVLLAHASVGHLRSSVALDCLKRSTRVTLRHLRD